MRFAAGWTVPCGAKVVDLRSRLSLPSPAHSPPGTGTGLALRALEVKARAPWFEHHTESRYLDEFSEAGMEGTYRRRPRFCACTPKSRASPPTAGSMTRSSTEISPRLGYLRQRPLERGAISCAGTHLTSTSRTRPRNHRTRRRLYEAGEYVPVAHRILWLRHDILDWADTAGQAPG